MKRPLIAVGSILLAIAAAAFRGPGAGHTLSAVQQGPLTPVADWSLEAQRAIGPPPAGVGDKFPGEAAVYMGIVHAAMYDAAAAIHRGYRPYAVAPAAPADTSAAAAIAAAAHGVLVELLPTQVEDLNNRYACVNGTTGCCVSPPTGASISCKQRACSHWRTSAAVMR